MRRPMRLHEEPTFGHIRCYIFIISLTASFCKAPYNPLTGLIKSAINNFFGRRRLVPYVATMKWKKSDGAPCGWSSLWLAGWKSGRIFLVMKIEPLKHH